MMREVLQRRFAAAEGGSGGAQRGEWPDLVLIDGGKGQLSAVCEVLESSACTTCRWWRSPRGRTAMPAASGSTCRARAVPAAAARSGALLSPAAARRGAPLRHRHPPRGTREEHPASELDEVPGIGAARKRALLNHFGTARAVKGAALDDLEAAPGISRETARRVYAHFHPGVRMEAVP